jgi:hypothetical protein
MVCSKLRPYIVHIIVPRSAGFGDKESLTYEDFKLMMKEFKGDFLAIGLDCKGAKQNYLDATTNVARFDRLDYKSYSIS